MIFVGALAGIIGGWLMYLSIVRDWHWVLIILGAPMVAGGTVVVMKALAQS